MQKWIIITIFSLVYPSVSYAQPSLKTFDISVSFTDLEQDQRLFDFPTTSGVLDMFDHPHSRDLEFSLLLRNRLIDGPNYRILIGLGYNQYIHRFRRPVNHCAFQGDPFCSLILLTTNRYKKHQLQVPLSLENNIVTVGDICLYLNLNIIPAFNLFRQFHGKSLSDFRFGFDGIEINPGAGVSFKRLYFQVNYRVFNRRRVDPVIFYDVLFNQTTQNLAPFLEQKFDSYNPRKLQFIVGYQITDPKSK